MMKDDTKLTFLQEKIEITNKYGLKSYYIGQYDAVRQVPHGIGRCVMEANTIHEGLFWDGKLNGYVRSFYPDGTVFIGNYLKG